MFWNISCTYSGWWFQPLWKIWKSVGVTIPNIWEKKCSKSPTRYMCVYTYTYILYMYTHAHFGFHDFFEGWNPHRHVGFTSKLLDKPLWGSCRKQENGINPSWHIYSIYIYIPNLMDSQCVAQIFTTKKCLTNPKKKDDPDGNPVFMLDFGCWTPNSSGQKSNDLFQRYIKYHQLYLKMGYTPGLQLSAGKWSS